MQIVLEFGFEVITAALAFSSSDRHGLTRSSWGIACTEGWLFKTGLDQ
jgi:hypothetical protein